RSNLSRSMNSLALYSGLKKTSSQYVWTSQSKECSIRRFCMDDLTVVWGAAGCPLERTRTRTPGERHPLTRPRGPDNNRRSNATATRVAWELTLHSGGAYD